MRPEEVKKLVRKASKLQHLAQLLPADSSTGESPSQLLITNDGEPLQLTFSWATLLHATESEWAFALFEKNMKQLYLRSQWGYDVHSKRQELGATTARYLIVHNLHGRPIAFVHFRFVEDEGRAVLYCYEIQVEHDYQQKGIGSLLIGLLEQLAKKTQMELVMATVFAFNAASLGFFHKCGFRSDASCMFGRDGAGGRDYVILSKRAHGRHAVDDQ